MIGARMARREFSAFIRAEEGGISILAAAFTPLFVVAGAVCVDLASLNLERRTAQSAVDLAAINAANNISTADEAARATLTANNIRRIEIVSVVKGHYFADPKTAPEQRFKAGELPYNAVQVSLDKAGNLYFAKMFMKTDPTIRVVATAQASAEATFSIGSRLAALRGGAVNALLGALVGTNVQLSAMDYEGLADGHIRVDDFLNSVSSQADLKAATFNDIASSTVKFNQILSAAAKVADTNGDASQAAIINSMIGGRNGSLEVPLSQFIDVGPYGSISSGQKTPGLAGTISLLDIVKSTAMIANGDHQVSFNFNAGLPGLAQIKIDLVIGERMQHSAVVSVGSVGATVSTAQTKVRIVAQVLGAGLLAPFSVKLPVYAELAYATGSLSDVTCDAADRGTVAVSTLPGVARAAIADVSDSELKNDALWLALKPGRLISAPLLTIDAAATIAITNKSPTILTFDQGDIDQNAIKRTSTTDFLETLVSSLLGSSKITISVAGLGISPLTTSQLRSALAPAASSLDGIVADVLATLGISLGEADVRVGGVHCGKSNLNG